MPTFVWDAGAGGDLFETRGEEGQTRFDNQGRETVGEEAEFLAQGRLVAEDGVDALWQRARDVSDRAR